MEKFYLKKKKLWKKNNHYFCTSAKIFLLRLMRICVKACRCNESIKAAEELTYPYAVQHRVVTGANYTQTSSFPQPMPLDSQTNAASISHRRVVTACKQEQHTRTDPGRLGVYHKLALSLECARAL